MIFIFVLIITAYTSTRNRISYCSPLVAKEPRFTPGYEGRLVHSGVIPGVAVVDVPPADGSGLVVVVVLVVEMAVLVVEMVVLVVLVVVVLVVVVLVVWKPNTAGPGIDICVVWHG